MKQHRNGELQGPAQNHREESARQTSVQSSFGYHFIEHLPDRVLNTICKTSPDPIKDKQKPFQAPKANASAFKGDDSGGGEVRPWNITYLINERPTI